MTAVVRFDTLIDDSSRGIPADVNFPKWTPNLNRSHRIPDGGMSFADHPRVMKSLRNRIRGARAQTYDFSLGRRGEDVRVHVSTGRVLIQCTKTSLSPRRRTAFVQYLVDEGFIPRGFVSSTEDYLPVVEWRMGAKPLSKKGSQGGTWHNRFMLRILGCSLVLCVIEMALLLRIAIRG